MIRRVWLLIRLVTIMLGMTLGFSEEVTVISLRLLSESLGDKRQV